MTYTVSGADFGRAGQGETKGVDSILQNVALILSTPKGSSPMYRDFGLDQSFLDKPLPVAKALLRVAVKEAVEDWEPRASVTAVSFSGDPASPAELCPSVTLEILAEE